LTNPHDDIPPAADLAEWTEAPARGAGTSSPQVLHQHLRGFWAVVLAGAVLCLLALFLVFFRMPGAGIVQDMGAIGPLLGQRMAVEPDKRVAIDDELDQCLQRLDQGLQADGLDRSVLLEFQARWQAARRTGDAQAWQELMPAAQTLATSIRANLDARHERLSSVIKIVTASMAGLLLLMIFGLLRHRSRLHNSLERLSEELGQQGQWQDALQALREERAGPQSTFEAVTTGVVETLRDNDRRWQALAELSADWYWETDAQNRLVRLYGSLAAFTEQGWQIEDLVGRRFDQLSCLKAPNLQGWQPLMEQLTGGGNFRDFECSVVARDKRSMRWMALSGRPRHDAHGMVAGFEGIARDITERRRQLMRLKASEQRWSTVVQLATDWYWESDENHRMQPMLMDAQTDTHGFAALLQGRTLWESFPFGLDEMAWELHRQDLAHRLPFRELELCIDTEDGQRHWLALSGMLRQDARGEFRGYRGVAREITGRKEAERVLMRHNEELQRAVTARTHELQAMNRDLEAFARQLAHELRTPISHIQGLAQLLLTRSGEQLSEDDRQLLDLQLQSAGGMRETVDALLTLASSTLQPMPTEAVDLSAMAHEVIDALPALEREAPVDWVIQEGLRALASPAPLKIVLTNLLGNAAKFTRRTAEPRVELRGHFSPGGTLTVVLEDNGTGFDPAKADRLFQPFGRLHADQDYHGTGIGLTIVQRIIERHGGQVRAEPREEGGARFTFTLPEQAGLNRKLPEELRA
jgi:PAS domain S-box-containing protein